MIVLFGVLEPYFIFLLSSLFSFVIPGQPKSQHVLHKIRNHYTPIPITVVPFLCHVTPQSTNYWIESYPSNNNKCNNNNKTGHLDGFSDPMVDCRESKLRYRADQLFYSPVLVTGKQVGYVCVQEANDEDMVKAAKKQAKQMLKEQNLDAEHMEAFAFKEVLEATEEEMSQIPSPGSGKPTLTMPRDFNLMFETKVGAMSDESSIAYLRPETAQGIFINFKNVLATSRQKIPFGIAQIGKAFRNEITPRNFIFRSREFEQMEVEYFIPPGDDVWPDYHQQWMTSSKQFLLDVGLREELMGWDIHKGDSLAHYALACTDITFKFPFGEQELMGIAARGNFDLTQHTEGSGKSTCCIYIYKYFAAMTFLFMDG